MYHSWIFRAGSVVLPAIKAFMGGFCMIAVAVLLATTCAFCHSWGYFSGSDAPARRTSFASGIALVKSEDFPTKDTLGEALKLPAKNRVRKRAGTHELNGSACL
jgi:hypothetical protein